MLGGDTVVIANQEQNNGACEFIVSDPIYLTPFTIHPIYHSIYHLLGSSRGK